MPTNDPIIREMLAEQAYGPITSSSYQDAAAVSRANETAHSLGLPPEIVQASLPDMMNEDRNRKLYEDAKRSEFFARLMANSRLAPQLREDPAALNAALRLEMHAGQTEQRQKVIDYSKLNANPLVGGLRTKLLATAAAGVGQLVSGVADIGGSLSRVASQAIDLETMLWGIPTSPEHVAPLFDKLSNLTDYQTSNRNVNDVLSGVRSLPGSLAALGVTAATGSPTLGAASLGLVTEGQSYKAGRDAGLDPLSATAYGVGDAIIETGTEIGPEHFLGRAFKLIPGGDGMLKEGAKLLGVEVGGELAATALQGLNKWYWIDRQKGVSFKQFTDSLPDQERSTVVATLTTMGITFGAGHIVQKLYQPIVDRNAAISVDRVMEAAAQSTTRTANPTDFSMALNQLVEGHPAETIYAPAEEIGKFFEAQKMTAQDVADDPFWGKYAPQLAEAQALGGDIAIPLADAATHLAGTPAWDAIKDHIRVSPSGMSLAEAKQKATPEQLEKMAGDMANLIHETLPRVQQAQALTAVKDFASGLGYTGEKADVISRYVAAGLYTAYQSAQAKAVAAGEQAVPIANFAASWLPQVKKQAQAEYDRSAPPEDVTTIGQETAVGQVPGGSAQGARGNAAEAGSVRGSGELRGSPEPVAAAPGEILGADQPISGAPKSLNVPGRGKVAVTPHVPARLAAAEHMRQAGLVYQPATSYAKVDPERATRLANAFEEMKHDPNDPMVQAAYQAMIEETLEQFQQIKQTGLEIEFIDETMDDPYAASPRLAILDVQENNHLWVFPTTGGFGQGEVNDSPMLNPTDEYVDGRRLLVNDVFRIVHDYFGHIKDGHGFRAEGEENAWQSHAAMYTPLARRAMTTETRGQNSWLNYGPHGESNRTALTNDTIFAPQKVGLMPEWASEEGMLAGEQSGKGIRDEEVSFNRGRIGAAEVVREGGDQGPGGSGPNALIPAQEIVAPPVDAEGQVTLDHWSPVPELSETDPNTWGRSGRFLPAEERQRIGIAPPRTYFGIATGQPGGYLGEFGQQHPVTKQQMYRYRGQIDVTRLYDMDADPDGLKAQGRAIGKNSKGRYEYRGLNLSEALPGIDGASLYEWLIHDAGYDGYWIKDKRIGMVAAVFQPVSMAPSETTLNQVAEPSGFERVAPFLTDEEREKMQNRSKAKLLEIIDTLPKAKEMAAVAHAGRAKKGWYARSAQAIVDVFGVEDGTRFAALLAALSPQTSVESNFYNALSVWTNWNDAGRPKDRETIVKIMGQSVQGNKGEKSVLGAWVPNSFAALTDENPASLKLSGPKVNSFFSNLVGVVDEVTNDTWMARYMGFEFQGGGRKAKHPTYLAMSAVTREAARVLTEQTGETWEPMEVQETVWSFAKTLYEMRDAAGVSATMEQLLEAGSVTHEEIAATPDFAVLFTDNVFRNILEAGGYGEKVANLEVNGQDVRLDEQTGGVTSAEGSGFTQSDYRAFLGSAAGRLEAVRDRRRANAEERRQQGQRQLSLTLNQDVTPTEQVFYSNAERAVEQAKQDKASAEQWAALLTPGRTPGIKAEEIEWTGILDWLKMQQGQIEKGALLQVLRDRGIHVEEVVLGANPNEDDELPSGYEVINRGTGYELLNPNGDPVSDYYPTEREAIHAAHEDASMGEYETKFESWSSDPRNSTYRELLITLPVGQGSNPERAPSTHWDTEGVVAHVRFMEKTDAEGKRVLFIEEVQSDWHQKGRDQGYEQIASPEQKAKIDAASAELRKVEEDERSIKVAITEKERALNAAAAPILTHGYDLFVKGFKDNPAYEKMSEAERQTMLDVMRRQTGAAFFDGRTDGGYVGWSDLRGWLGMAERQYQAVGEEWPVEIDNMVTEITDLSKERSRLSREAELKQRELSVAKGTVSGIPNAPFKSSWPALVMKRAIRWAVDHGYDKIAWTTGEEQAARYNLGFSVGKIEAQTENDGSSFNVIVSGGQRVYDTLVNNDMAFYPERGQGVMMKPEQLKAAFGENIANKIITQGAPTSQAGGPVVELDGEDLNVGGEGMKAFYDRNLVNITNDIIKKYGARVGPVGLRVAGATDENKSVYQNFDGSWGYHNRLGDPINGFSSRVEAAAAMHADQSDIASNPGFDITPQLAEAAGSGFSLFQQKRGNISIQHNEEGIMHGAIIRAFEASNFSTAVHELGHFFLEDLKRRALTTGATAQEQQDWQTFKDWAASLGHEIGDDSMIPPEAHEYFARGMERFVWEGQAPSRGLRAIFTRMREFMLELYRSATAFNAPITPEIRDVMNRMLASQEEIDQQRADLKLVNDKVKSLLTETEQRAYDDLAEEARQDARDKVFKRVLSALRQQKRAEVKAQKERIRFEAEAQVAEQPIHRALKSLRVGLPLPDGGFAKAKIDRAWLIEHYGEDAEERMPKGVPPIISDNDTVDADNLAQGAGFTSGDQMIQAMMRHEAQRQQMKTDGDRRSPRQKAVDDIVDQRVKEELGDPFAHLEEEAQDAVASDRQADLMSMEVRALARKTGQKPTPWKMAKEWAAARIGITTAKDAISGRSIQGYARAVAKAGKEYEEHLIAGDFEEAFRAKQRQLLNMALMSEAKKAANDIDAAVRRMQKLAARETIPSIDQDYLEQAHALLSDVDLRKRSGTDVERQAAFADWHAKQVQLGILPFVPPSYRETLGKTHWTKLTVPELLELDKAVAQIVELGRLKQTLKDGQRQRDFDEAVAEMVGTAELQKTRRKSGEIDPRRTLPDRISSILRSADAAMLKMEQMARWLDGDDPNGPWSRLIFRVMAEAQGRETDLMRAYVTEINGLIKGLPKKMLKRWSDKVDTPELVIRNSGHLLNGQAPQLHKDQVVMMAMNFGNEGNKQRLLDGYGWEEAAVLQVFDRHMTKEDWEFVQNIWNTVDKLWPEIEALERRVNGLAPEKVEPTPIRTKHGIFSGGYFPVIYDSSQSSRANIDEENKLAPEGGFMMVTTRASSTKQRAERVNDRPLLLSMGVITRHISEVIHDVTHREAVMQVKKLLGDNRVGNVVRSRLGPEYLKAMGSWLENIARPGIAYSKEAPALTALGRYLNKAVSMVGLGFRVTTVTMQLLGLPIVAAEVGEKHLAVAIGTTIAHPIQAWNEMNARSAEMRARADTLDATLEDMVANQASGKLRMIGPRGIQKYAFQGIAYMDMVVSTTAWTAGFNKGLAEGMSEEEAVHYADSVVRMTQGAGGQKDRSPILNAHPMARSLYSFFSYLNALFNMQRDVFRRVGQGEYAEAARRAWWVMLVPMLLQAAIFGPGPDDDDDDGEVDVGDWAKYLCTQVAIGNLGSLPLIGTLASALGQGYNYRSSAYQQIGEGLVKGEQDTVAVVKGDKELSGSVVKSTVTTVGLITAKPTGQIGAAAGGLYDYHTGEADPQTAGDWYNLLTKGFIPDKKQTVIQDQTGGR